VPLTARDVRLSDAGSERRTVKVTRLAHLDIGLMTSRPDHDGSVKPVEEKRTCAVASCVGGCAAASVRYHDEIRVFFPSHG